MTRFDRSQTVSLAEAQLMETIRESPGSTYLRGHDLRRARRLEGLGLVELGILGERYYVLTSKGTAFLAKLREGNAEMLS